MATIKINYNNVISASGTANSAKSKLNTAKNNIASSGARLDYSIKQRANIGNRINTLYNNIDYISSIVSDVANVCNRGVNTYKNADANVFKMMKKVDSSKVSDFTVANVIALASVSNQKNEKKSKDIFKTWFDKSLLTGEIGGKTSILGIGTSGSISGGLLNGKVESKLKSKYSIKDREFGIEAVGEASGSLAKGAAQGNIGYLSGKAEAEIGAASVKGTVGATLFKDGKFTPSLNAKAEASAAAAKGSVEAKFGTDKTNKHVKAEGSVLKAEASASAGVGKVTYTDAQGNKDTAIGVTGTVKAGACLAEGKVSGGFTVFGVKIDAGLTGKAGAVGVEAGGSITNKGASGKIGGALGVGGGVEISVDWSGFSLW